MTPLTQEQLAKLKASEANTHTFFVCPNGVLRLKIDGWGDKIQEAVIGCVREQHSYIGLHITNINSKTW